MGMQGMDGTSATGYAHANDMGANGVFVCETQWGDNKTIDMTFYETWEKKDGNS